MSEPEPHPTPAPAEAGKAGDAHSGSGAQTALWAMLKKRNGDLKRDPDPAPPADETTR